MTPRVLLASALLATATAASLAAQTPPLKIKEDAPGLLKMAKVAPEAALATAAAAVPGGTLKSAEIEREDGVLVYVFSFTKAGAKGEEEVLVNARTGKVQKTEHESEEDEAKEEAEERAAKAAKNRKPAKPPSA